LSVLQKAQSAKGKLAEKSPQAEAGPSITADASRVNELILQQGDIVRKLKSEKASEVLNYVEYLLNIFTALEITVYYIGKVAC
jgi:hypothetical protein